MSWEAWFLFAFLISVSLQCDGNHTTATTADDFEAVALKEWNFEKLWPYDLPLADRYSCVDGVRRLWVYSTDKPHSRGSRTKSRTEIAIRLIDGGYTYSSGVWQFEGQAYVPNATSGVCIMQIFGATSHASTLMLWVYNGSLKYYRRQVVEDNIYDRWFKVNVIHNMGTKLVKIFINDELKLVVDDQGGSKHSFKFGVYTQNNSSDYMESRWKGIKVLKLSNGGCRISKGCLYLCILHMLLFFLNTY